MKRHFLLAAAFALTFTLSARLGAQDRSATDLPVPDLSGLDMSDLDMSEPDLPTVDMPEPDLPNPEPPAEPEPQPIPLLIDDLLGTWHGIDPNPGSFSAWEIDYRADGTYQLRVFGRDFDIPVEDGIDTEDVTDGTWQVTEQGFLEFDGGEMLFQAIGRDPNRIIYQASFPTELDSVPWIVHEFRGPAPPVIFELAPFIDKKQGSRGPLQIQTANLRHLLLGCSVYAVDHGGQFPAKLPGIAPNIGAETLDEMKNFTDPDTGKRTPWTLLPGGVIADPHDTVLLHSPEFGGGRRIVGFIDGSVTVLELDEFAAKMDRQTR